VQVKDAAGQQISKIFSVVIAAALTITTATLPDGVAGTAYSATLSETGGTAPYAWSIATGSLPPGITLASGGTVAGTPSASGSYKFTLQIQDATGKQANSASGISVLAPPVTVSVLPATVSLSAGQTKQFTATVIGTTNKGVTWSVSPAVGTISSTGLYSAPAALTSSQTVTVTATSMADTSKKAAASVTIMPAVTVSVSPTAATMLPSQAQTFTPTVGGTPNTGVTWSIAPATGTISSNGLYTAPATITPTSPVTVTATSVADTTKSASATVTLIPPVQITTISLPGGTAGTAYSAAVSATGGVAPYTWSIASGQLPAGLSLSTSSAAISGTPATAGSYNITMKVTDAAGYQATALLALAIASCTGCSRPLSISTSSLPSGTVGVPYNSTLMATGGTAPYKWSTASGQLPAGLGLDPAAGAISGTPSTAGAYTFTLAATDASFPANTASQALATDITAAPATDQYGGLTSLMSPGSLTGKWNVEKYTIGSTHRWLITTPEGHGLFCNSAYGFLSPPSLNKITKYGSADAWEIGSLQRYTAQGFNCLAEYSDNSILLDIVNAKAGVPRLPFFNLDHWINDAVMHRTEITGQVLSSEPVKDLSRSLGKPRNNGGWWNAMMPDPFDPNWLDYIEHFAAARVTPANLSSDSYAKVWTSSWNIAMGLDDSDYTYGLGPGPDDCTSYGNSYHIHLGWAALASRYNVYSKWADTGNPYSHDNWVSYADTQNYAKKELITELRAKYGTIGALNSAWGTSGYYTTWGTTGTRTMGEAVGTTDGTAYSWTHTLAVNPTQFGPGSLVIKMDGTQYGTDFIPNSNSATTTIVGQSFDGTHSMSGTVTLSSGSVQISFTQYYQDTIASTGVTNWPSSTLANPAIATNCVTYGYNIVLRVEPEDSRVGQDSCASPGTISGGGVYTASGSWNMTTGTITNLVITPAIPVGHSLRIQYNHPVAPATGHAITIDYEIGGFGYGTGLQDEDGRHTAWLGPVSGILKKTTVPLAVWTDLNAFLYQYGDKMFAAIDNIRSYFPLTLWGSTVLGGHDGCVRKELAVAAAAHADILFMSELKQPQIDMLHTWGIDKPVTSWEAWLANADSPMSANAADTQYSEEFTTQAARGAAFAADYNSVLLGGIASGGDTYPVIAFKLWQYNDQPGETRNYGLQTVTDNAYDGVEAATGIHACSVPLQSHVCGGEAANHGDAITALRNALRSMWELIRR